MDSQEPLIYTRYKCQWVKCIGYQSSWAGSLITVFIYNHSLLYHYSLLFIIRDWTFICFPQPNSLSGPFPKVELTKTQITASYYCLFPLHVAFHIIILIVLSLCSQDNQEWDLCSISAVLTCVRNSSSLFHTQHLLLTVLIMKIEDSSKELLSTYLS